MLGNFQPPIILILGDLTSPHLCGHLHVHGMHTNRHTHIIRHINTRIKNINLKTVLDSSLMILTIILEFLSSDFQIKSIPFVRKELFCCVIINFALQNSIKTKCTPQFLIGSIKDVIDWSSIYSFRRRQFQKTQFIAIYCVLCSIWWCTLPRKYFWTQNQEFVKR